MSSKPNWACVACGMFSSRKSAVKRHIQNLHGSGHLLRYIDHVTGRQAGYYAPSSFPSFIRKAKPEDDVTKLNDRAYQEGFYSEAGRDAYKQGHRPNKPHRFV